MAAPVGFDQWHRAGRQVYAGGRTGVGVEEPLLREVGMHAEGPGRLREAFEQWVV